jgi:hypothetical protein
MMEVRAYDTVSEAVKDLKARGFKTDFNLRSNCIVCDDLRLHPEDFEIVETYRFEGPSDPADLAIVYAIESKEGSKGILVNGYGIYNDPMSSEMADKLAIHH